MLKIYLVSVLPVQPSFFFCFSLFFFPSAPPFFQFSATLFLFSFLFWSAPPFLLLFSAPFSCLQRLTSSFLQTCCPFFFQRFCFNPKPFSVQPKTFFSAQNLFQPKMFLLQPKTFFSSAQNLFFSPKRFPAQDTFSACLWFSASFFSSFAAPLFFLLTCCPFLLLLFSLLFLRP